MNHVGNTWNEGLIVYRDFLSFYLFQIWELNTKLPIPSYSWRPCHSWACGRSRPCSCSVISWQVSPGCPATPMMELTPIPFNPINPKVNQPHRRNNFFSAQWLYCIQAPFVLTGNQVCEDLIFSYSNWHKAYNVSEGHSAARIFSKNQKDYVLW